MKKCQRFHDSVFIEVKADRRFWPVICFRFTLESKLCHRGHKWIFSSGYKINFVTHLQGLFADSAFGEITSNYRIMSEPWIFCTPNFVNSRCLCDYKHCLHNMCRGITRFLS
jgi:hypothetical protein